MKIDEKTLSILGAPKKGFEWVALEWPAEHFRKGDYTLNGLNQPIEIETDFQQGWAAARGFYRQVPIEPEPEVIWGPHMNNYAEYRILVDGTLQVNHGPEWKGVEMTGHAGVKIAADYATQHKELKALKEKLGEIRAEAAIVNGALFSQSIAKPLVELCLALEVE